MIKEVSEVYERTESGATDPLIGVVDKKQVIIKVSKNPYGPRVLINEFVCLELAKILELPICDGGICLINKNTNLEENEEVYGNFYNSVNINLEVLKYESRIFKERLTRESISEILNKLPDKLIKNEDKESILEYLLHRVNIIDEICEFINGKISSSGGEVDENSFFSTNI